MTQRVGARTMIARCLAIAVVAVLALAFAAYSLRFGLRGLVADLSDETYLHAAGAPWANLAVFSHMALGAAIMLLAPLQLVTAIRVRYPRLHRVSGRVVIGAALATALGGLSYIALRGTVGGPAMDAGFALYGAALMIVAVQTVRRARAGDVAHHREWALRLAVLALGSLIYRLHYTLWYLVTGGAWSAPDFSGVFDHIQNFAFYLPYLVALEVHLRRRRSVPAGAGLR